MRQKLISLIYPGTFIIYRQSGTGDYWLCHNKGYLFFLRLCTILMLPAHWQLSIAPPPPPPFYTLLATIDSPSVPH